ncbi:MAG: glycosyltransferase family 4 protein [bacterium]|nr:glycosyltransferase family 4 protein [bacterium]
MAKGRVGVLTTYHVHEDGKRVIYGGAERYGIEFTRMLVEMEYDVTWWQIGSGWTQEVIPGVPLHSVPLREAAYQTCPSLNRAFFEQADRIDHAVYFSTLLAYPQAFERSIAISHGVYWDYPTWETIVPTERHRAEWRARWYAALNKPQKVVSCDTATIRFITATWPGLAEKLEYVPNFVNLEEFHPPDADAGRASVRVLLPRRLTAVRGINETLTAMERLLAAYPQLEFHLVGRGHSDHQERDMLRWAHEHPRAYYYWRPPHLMPHVYRNMDIVLIPSKAAEGTSLSCLEAMAVGRAVVAGCTGGLTDLILDGYNGLLLRPVTVRTLVEAIEALVTGPDLRRELGERAEATARAFGLDQWKERWRRVIERVFR